MIKNYYHLDSVNQTVVLSSSCVSIKGHFNTFDLHGTTFQIPFRNLRISKYSEILEYLKVEWDLLFDKLTNAQYKEIDSLLKIDLIEDAFFIYHLESDIELMKEYLEDNVNNQEK